MSAKDIRAFKINVWLGYCPQSMMLIIRESLLLLNFAKQFLEV
jgi:hypothetical protein